MMTHRLSVAALVLGLAAFAALAPATAKPAAACSMGPLTLERAAEVADLVIVGEVVSEQSVSPQLYTSTIGVSATLKGDSEREFTLERIGQLYPDCSGGPRLAAGERVLLFLNGGRGQLQVTGYEGGKYVLSETKAMTAWEDTAIPVEDALRRVAAITGAAPGQLDAALAFANGEPLPELENGDLMGLLIGLAAAGALVLLPALLFAVRRRRSAS